MIYEIGNVLQKSHILYNIWQTWRRRLSYRINIISHHTIISSNGKYELSLDLLELFIQDLLDLIDKVIFIQVQYISDFRHHVDDIGKRKPFRLDNLLMIHQLHFLQFVECFILTLIKFKHQVCFLLFLLIIFSLDICQLIVEDLLPLFLFWQNNHHYLSDW